MHPASSTFTQLISASTQRSATSSTLLDQNITWKVIRQFPKFRQKNPKLFVLPENWHTCYLEDADSYSDISFLNFQLVVGQNSFWGKFGLRHQSCPFCLKTGTRGILKILIPKPDLRVEILTLKLIFG